MIDKPQPGDRSETSLGPRVIEVEATQPERPPEIEGPKQRVIETDTIGPITPTEPSQKLPAPTELAPERRLRRGVKFALAGIVASVVSWLVIDAIDWIVTAYARNMALGILASTAAVAGAIGAGYVIASELRSFLRLRSVEAMQQQFSNDISRIPPSEARREITSVLAVIPRTRATEAAIESFQRQVQVHHTAAQQIQILSQTALKPLDHRAEEVVRSAAVQAFGITAVSPTALSDSLFFLACGLRMVRQVAECYGHRPGVATTTHLLRRLLIEAGTLGAGDLAIQHVSALVDAVPVLKHVATGATESLYAAQRMARLGIITMGMCRPIPFKTNEAPSIPSLIGHLISHRSADSSPSKL